MTRDDREMTVEERNLATELAGLVDDPSAARRARILKAVHAAPSPRRAGISAWRVAIALAAALAVVAVSSVGAIAASGDALPSSPSYGLRSFGEHVRLAFANPSTREQLRLSFAQSRIAQAQSALVHGDRSNARGLLHDSAQYLADTRQDIGQLGSDEQGHVENQLNEEESQQNHAEGQLNQQGEQGQQGQSGGQ